MFKAAFQSAKKQERYHLMYHIKCQYYWSITTSLIYFFLSLYVYMHLRIYLDNSYISICYNNIKKLKHSFLWVDFYLAVFCHSDLPL